MHYFIQAVSAIYSQMKTVIKLFLYSLHDTFPISCCEGTCKQYCSRKFVHNITQFLFYSNLSVHLKLITH